MTTPHPAKFTDSILDLIEILLPPPPLDILDPFAGVGKVHQLPHHTVGIEIEPEWANQHPDTMVGNALALPFDDESFDAIVTSPCYGNRMADHHNAQDGSRRVTYRHLLGRPLHPDNSGQLQWGDKYRIFHRKAWAESFRVLKSDGLFVLNISNHIRGKQVASVTAFHRMTLRGLGLEEESIHWIETPRLRHGENHQSRMPYEAVVVLRKL